MASEERGRHSEDPPVQNELSKEVSDTQVNLHLGDTISSNNGANSTKDSILQTDNQHDVNGLALLPGNEIQTEMKVDEHHAALENANSDRTRAIKQSESSEQFSEEQSLMLKSNHGVQVLGVQIVSREEEEQEEQEDHQPELSEHCQNCNFKNASTLKDAENNFDTSYPNHQEHVEDGEEDEVNSEDHHDDEEEEDTGENNNQGLSSVNYTTYIVTTEGKHIPEQENQPFKDSDGHESHEHHDEMLQSVSTQSGLDIAEAKDERTFQRRKPLTISELEQLVHSITSGPPLYEVSSIKTEDVYACGSLDVHDIVLYSDHDLHLQKHHEGINHNVTQIPTPSSNQISSSLLDSQAGQSGESFDEKSMPEHAVLQAEKTKSNIYQYTSNSADGDDSTSVEQLDTLPVPSRSGTTDTVSSGKTSDLIETAASTEEEVSKQSDQNTTVDYVVMEGSDILPSASFLNATTNGGNTLISNETASSNNVYKSSCSSEIFHQEQQQQQQINTDTDNHKFNYIISGNAVRVDSLIDPVADATDEIKEVPCHTFQPEGESPTCKTQLESNVGMTESQLPNKEVNQTYQLADVAVNSIQHDIQKDTHICPQNHTLQELTSAPILSQHVNEMPIPLQLKNISYSRQQLQQTEIDSGFEFINDPGDQLASPPNQAPHIKAKEPNRRIISKSDDSCSPTIPTKLASFYTTVDADEIISSDVDKRLPSNPPRQHSVTGTHLEYHSEANKAAHSQTEHRQQETASPAETIVLV
eukprot:gene6695-9451_t